MTQFDPKGDVEFQLQKLLNNGLDFQDNIRGGFVEYTTSGGEDVVQHGLGYVPAGFIVILKTGEGEIWATEEQLQQWDRETLFLQSSVKSLTVRLYVV